MYGWPASAIECNNNIDHGNPTITAVGMKSYIKSGCRMEFAIKKLKKKCKVVIPTVIFGHSIK